jgi:hypothetical protein
MPKHSLSVTDPTHCINKEILSARNNDVEHISQEVPSSINGQVKTYPSEHSTVKHIWRFYSNMS